MINFNNQNQIIIKKHNKRIMREIIRKTSKFETPRERMNRMKILRQIRKQKLIQIGYLVQDTQVNNIQKDDKVHIQKLKNREAAQTSRQQKKRYLTKLEQQIEQLKNRLQNSRFCQNCKKQLQIDDHVIPSETQNSTRQESFLRNQIEIQQNQDSQISQYWRVNSSGQNSSIGIYLFVFMIVLGVFCLGSRVDSDRSFNPNIRDLTQLYSNPSSSATRGINNSPIVYENNMRSSYSTNDYKPPIDDQTQNGLISMSSVTSSTSISDDKCFEQIITSFENYKMDTYEDKHLRSKNGIIDANKSLMFCSRPKIYKSNQNNDGIFTSFIDIFVKGAEIINIFPQNALQSSLSQNLQLNRLYKITASVQQIQQIGNMNYIY